MSDAAGLAEAMQGLEGFTVPEVAESSAEVVIRIETTGGLVGCPGCGTVATAHDQMAVKLRDLPVFGRPARLVWCKRRWRCEEREILKHAAASLLGRATGRDEVPVRRRAGRTVSDLPASKQRCNDRLNSGSSDPGKLSARCTGSAWSGRWAASAQPATTPQWNRSSPCFRRTSSTRGPGRPGTSCASRPSHGSNAPTTADADNNASAG
jgi:hypothetical protein